MYARLPFLFLLFSLSVFLFSFLLRPSPSATLPVTCVSSRSYAESLYQVRKCCLVVVRVFVFFRSCPFFFFFFALFAMSRLACSMFTDTHDPPNGLLCVIHGSGGGAITHNSPLSVIQGVGRDHQDTFSSLICVIHDAPSLQFAYYVRGFCLSCCAAMACERPASCCRQHSAWGLDAVITPSPPAQLPGVPPH